MNNGFLRSYAFNAKVQKILLQRIVALFLLLLAPVVVLGAPHEKPLYLSFEKRLVMTYLIAGAGESANVQAQLAKRLQQSVVNYLKAPRASVPVQNFQQFLRIYQGPWPDSYSVRSDLELIEKKMPRGFVSYEAVDLNGNPNAKLQSQIDGFLVNQNRQLAQRMQSTSDQLLENVVEIASGVLESPKPNVIALAFVSTEAVLKKQFAQMAQIGTLIANSGKLDQMEPGEKLLIKTVLQEYFARLSVKTKKQIVSRFLGQNLTSPIEKKFEIMLMSSGSVFQKFMQALASDPKIPQDFQQLLEKLESNITPIPAEISSEIIEKERDRYQIVDFKPEPLATASVGQIHEGHIRDSKGELVSVAIKFQKPEIEERIEEDARVLLESAQVMDSDAQFAAAGFPKIVPLVNDIVNGVRAELDLPATIERQQKAHVAFKRTVLIHADGYKNYLTISVPKIFPGGPGSKLLVAELVDGDKLAKEVRGFENLIQNLGSLNKKLVEAVIRVWVEETFFKSGILHSDMHPGNYLSRITDHEISVNILDFGMGGYLNREMQTQLILASIALNMQRSDLLAKSFISLSNGKLGAQTGGEYERKIAEQMKKVPYKDSTMFYWIKWSLNEGVQFPEEIISLRRGMDVLDKALARVGSSYTVEKMAQELAPKYAKSHLYDLKTRGLLKMGEMVKVAVQAAMGTKKAPVCSQAHSR